MVDLYLFCIIMIGQRMLNFSNGLSYEFDKLKIICLYIIDDIKILLMYDVIYNYVIRQSYREKFISIVNF